MHEFSIVGSQKESGYVQEIRCKPEYHKFLIGRGGANIRKVRDSTGARVIFPGNNTEEGVDAELITIMGREEAVIKAKQQLELLIKDLVGTFRVMLYWSETMHTIPASDSLIF